MKKKGKKASSGLDSEERELFLRAYYEGFVSEEIITPHKSQKKEQQSNVVEDSDRELFLSTINSVHVKIQQKNNELLEKKSSAKKTAKKREYYDAKIDLHGFFEEDAIRALLAFIRKERSRGSRVLLVIHGKGRGTLKDAVLCVADTHADVLDFCAAPGRLGGEGALILRLGKSKKDKANFYK
jgi:DNA-nicking Smr family endonuclease